MKLEARGRKALIISTVIVLCILILCTFLSRTIYNASLKRVEVAKLESGSVTSSFTQTGWVEYADRVKMRYSVPLVVKEVLKNANATVQEGETLMVVDIAEYELQASEMELEIRQLESQLSPAGLSSAQVNELLAERDLVAVQLSKAIEDRPIGLSNDADANLEIQRLELELMRIDNQLSPSGLSNKQIELLTAQRSILERKLELFLASYPADGLVVAASGGTLSAVFAEPGDTVAANSSLLEIVPKETKSQVRVELPNEQAEIFTVGDRAVVTLPAGPAGQNKQQSSGISRIERNADTGMTTLTVRLNETGYKEGTSMSVRLEKSYGTYDKVVPLTAVSGSEGDYRIYTLKKRDGLFGEERYVQEVKADKLAESVLSMAIQADALWEGDLIVVSSSGYLVDGETVWVEES